MKHDASPNLQADANDVPAHDAQGVRVGRLIHSDIVTAQTALRGGFCRW
jgi:hypothetical protein